MNLNSEMVVLAREYRNMTQEQLAREICVTQATIAKIEGGLSTDIADDLIIRIGKALKFPKDFFYLNEERLNFGSSSYYYRKKSKISAADRKFITGLVNLSRISIKRLLEAVDIDANRDLPFMPIEESGGRASNVAKGLRAKWSLPDGPIKNLTSLMESAGILIIPCDFGTRHMDATSIHLTDMPPLVFINKDLPGDRWRFTLAHELAHLVMHDTPTETMEDEADSFAGEFLTPALELRAQFKRLGKIRIQDLVNMKPYWQVSMQSLLVQAAKLNAINSNQKRYLWSTISRLGYRLREPNPIPVEKTQNYQNLFKYYKDVLGYSIEDMAKSVVLIPSEFESLHGACFPSQQSQTQLRVVR